MGVDVEKPKLVSSCGTGKDLWRDRERDGETPSQRTCENHEEDRYRDETNGYERRDRLQDRFVHRKKIIPINEN